MVSVLRVQAAFAKRADEEIERKADEVLIGFTEMVIYGLVKKVSGAVGLEELKETYYHVRRLAGEDDISTRLIDLAIVLDHFGTIPETDVKDLEQRLRKNPAAYTILTLLVKEYLTLFPTDYKTLQKMAQLFNFRQNDARAAGKKIKSLPA
jgi:hypothetical protein